MPTESDGQWSEEAELGRQTLRGGMMKPSLQERLFNIGCLLVFVGVCALIYLSVTSHWMYSLAIVGLLLFWGLTSRIRVRSLHRKHLDVLTTVFSASERDIPRLEEGSVYGWPTFGLIFASASGLKLAEESGCIAAFKQAIQSLYGHAGSTFDADRAVWATYEDQYRAHFPA